jgi:hypothetical protein
MPRQSFGTGWFREKYAHQEPMASVVPTGTVTESGSNLIGSVLDLQGAMSVLASIELATLTATSVEVVAEISLDQVNWYRVGGSKLEATGTTNVAHNTDAGRYLRFRAVVAGGTALATPVVSGATPEGAGGTLAPGTYRYVVTALDAAGQTVASNEVTATVTAGQKVKVAWAEVAGATGGYRVYRSPVGGAAHSENVYQATAAEATVVSFVDSGAAGTAGTPPAAGTSGADAVLGINVQTVRDRKPGGINNE